MSRIINNMVKKWHLDELKKNENPNIIGTSG